MSQNMISKRKSLTYILLIVTSIFIPKITTASILIGAQSDIFGSAGVTSGLGVTILAICLVILAAIFIALLVLANIRKQIDEQKWTNENPDMPYPFPNKSMIENLKEQAVISFNKLNPNFIILTIVGIIAVFSISDWYNRAQDLGSQHGYAPEQPIKFNHKVHAGQLNIQCQYCHNGAEKGKQSGIPSLSTCMNCHNYVKEGHQYGTAEISKITEAYTNKKPVKWVRIHNLPDHVYFNHSQHVVAGKLKCQNCHGAVQEMEKVQQVSTLEMGWCINCHREMKIDETNPYYAQTYDFVKKHKEIKMNGAKYTVAQMGGLECAKCHY
jgi:preprotein translocase subunit SecG